MHYVTLYFTHQVQFLELPVSSEKCGIYIINMFLMFQLNLTMFLSLFLTYKKFHLHAFLAGIAGIYDVSRATNHVGKYSTRFSIGV